MLLLSSCLLATWTWLERGHGLPHTSASQNPPVAVLCYSCALSQELFGKLVWGSLPATGRQAGWQECSCRQAHAQAGVGPACLAPPCTARSVPICSHPRPAACCPSPGPPRSHGSRQRPFSPRTCVPGELTHAWAPGTEVALPSHCPVLQQPWKPLHHQMSLTPAQPPFHKAPQLLIASPSRCHSLDLAYEETPPTNSTSEQGGTAQ